MAKFVLPHWLGKAAATKVFGATLLFSCISAFLSLALGTIDMSGRGFRAGGYAGDWLAAETLEYLNRTGSLIVAGNAKSFAIIEGLLQSLDRDLPFDLRDIRILPLEHADANVVAGTLQKLMDARLTQRVTLNKGQSDALKVVILADPRSNALLVGGGRDAFDMVQALAKQLDTAAPALSGRIRLVAVQFADARVLAATLTTLFDQRYSAARTTDVQRNKPVILPDPRSNSLLITASQDDNRAIDELLQRLDTRLDNPALQLTVLPLVGSGCENRK